MEKQLLFIEVPASSNLENQPNCSHMGRPRLNSPVRNQIEYSIHSLEDSIPQDHIVRLVWNYVEHLDMSNILGTIQSVEGSVGRPATNPKILLALWLFATLQGIVSARVIADYCEEHIAYKWLCGGVKTNQHTLSDFAAKYGEQFDEFLTQSIAILVKEGFVDLEEVSQDGMRVRANAGTSSFRREKTLIEYHERAKNYLINLRKELEKNPSAGRSKKEGAALRAAEERERKTKRAIEELKKLKEEKHKGAKKLGPKRYNKFLEEIRSSITDPESRNMKMACGGFRPAYNVQFATTKKGRAIIGVDVNNQGSDKGLIKNMIDYVRIRYQTTPTRWLVDAGYNKLSEIDEIAISYKMCKIFMPPREDCYCPQEKDSDAVIRWRTYMNTEEAKGIYKGRSSTAEFSNAQARNKGLQQFLVRGLKRAKAVAYRFALAHNMQRFFSMKMMTA